MIKPISVYDGHTRKRLAYLQNAYDIKYNKFTNALWTGEFTLPYSDPKRKYCESFNYVEIWDQHGGEDPRYIGLFRIMPSTEETLGTEANVVYHLEHVLSTLIDDVMVGFFERGNTGVYTKEVMNFILNNQSEKRWVLGLCDYEHQFLYGWDNENLLSALFSIPQPFEETDYYWDFDTIHFPWTLNLRKTNKTPVTDIRYRKNLNGLTRIVDPTDLTTRLYCYGYGSGDNKLGISEVNNGVPYLESPNVSKYGVITQIWNDERYTIAESLLEVGKAMLKKLEEPAVSYEIDIQAIYNASDLEIGDTVRVVSLGLDELMTVKEIFKDDVTGAPQSGKIVLGAGTIDISSSIAELAERQRIAETYSQGAESIFTDSFMDNADEGHPGIIYFMIPENAVHVNEILFSCRLNYFRAYSKAVDGGGQEGNTTEDGGGGVVTSYDGGGMTTTSSSGGGGTKTSSSGGGGTKTSSSGGGGTETSSSGGGESKTTGTGIDVEYSWTNTGITDGHNHSYRYVLGHAHRFSVSSHRHDVSFPSHRHDVQIDNHTHNVQIDSHTHNVTLAAHKHDVALLPHKHRWALPNHTHNIEYGVYENNRVPATMKVYLDDVLVRNSEGGEDHPSNITDLNLIPYVSKDANGKVMRGHHTIKIVPGRRQYNDAQGNIKYDTKARVEATFLIRLFTNMHGGSQY